MEDPERSRALLRREVVVARQSQWIGSTVVHPPRIGSTMAVCAFVVALAVAGLLTFGTFADREHAVGSLTSANGLATLVPVHSGIIESVEVDEGDHVLSGQEIMVISSDQDTGESGSARAAISSDLLSKQRQLEVDLLNQKAAAASQEGLLVSQLKMLAERQSELAGQVMLQQERADGARKILEQWTIASNKGVATRMQVLQQKDSMLQHQLIVKQLRTQALELRQLIAEQEAKIDAVRTRLAASLSETVRSIADVSNAQTENNASRRVVLRAPVDGIISGLLVHPGQSVAAGQELVAVSPAGSSLIGELWFPGTSMSRLKVGQHVTMRYAAARSSSEGIIHGKVAKIAGSATMPSRVKQMIGRDVDGARYRVTVSLTRTSHDLDRLGLRAGMDIDADVSVARRRLLDWIIDPFFEQSGVVPIHFGSGSPVETTR